VLADFRGLPEAASGEVGIVELSVLRGRGFARRAALAAEAAAYAPLKRLVDRLVADPRFAGVAVTAASREGTGRRVELDLRLVEEGRTR
jgi:hypothetical protein